MLGYILSWKDQPTGTVDARNLRPDLIGRLPKEELARQRLTIGNRDYRFDDLFTILGDSGPSLTITGNVNYLMLAQGMAKGELIVDGEAGDLAGMNMQGGNLRILGSAGHSLGASMSGGQIEVLGDVGPRAGGPAPDSTHGMTDGEILIQGRAGSEAGFRLHRGLLAMSNCDELLGHHMLAGTLLINAGELIHPGLNARRGSIVYLNSVAIPTWELTYRPDCVYQPVWVRVLMRYLHKQEFPLADGALTGSYQLFSGDRLNTSQAEILQLQKE